MRSAGSRSVPSVAAAVRVVLLAGLLAAAPAARAGSEGWTVLAGGLELGNFTLPGASAHGAQARVLRVDPRRWELTLHGLPRGESGGYTAREWCRREGLVAAINAGMYQEDYRTHAGHMAADGSVLSRGTNGYLSAAAFAPVDPNDAPFRIFDLDETPLAALQPRYRRLVQNLRLIKRPGENRWAPQGRRWSEAALGEDREGRALLIFCAEPLALDRLNAILLDLPLGIVAAQHLEGGAQAQLAVGLEAAHLEFVGVSAGELFAVDPLRQARPIPNVIGVRARPTPKP